MLDVVVALVDGGDNDLERVPFAKCLRHRIVLLEPGAKPGLERLAGEECAAPPAITEDSCALSAAPDGDGRREALEPLKEGLGGTTLEPARGEESMVDRSDCALQRSHAGRGIGEGGAQGWEEATESAPAERGGAAGEVPDLTAGVPCPEDRLIECERTTEERVADGFKMVEVTFDIVEVVPPGLKKLTKEQAMRTLDETGVVANHIGSGVAGGFEVHLPPLDKPPLGALLTHEQELVRGMFETPAEVVNGEAHPLPELLFGLRKPDRLVGVGLSARSDVAGVEGYALQPAALVPTIPERDGQRLIDAAGCVEVEPAHPLCPEEAAGPMEQFVRGPLRNMVGVVGREGLVLLEGLVLPDVEHAGIPYAVELVLDLDAPLLRLLPGDGRAGLVVDRRGAMLQRQTDGAEGGGGGDDFALRKAGHRGNGCALLSGHRSKREHPRDQCVRERGIVERRKRSERGGGEAGDRETEGHVAAVHAVALGWRASRPGRLASQGGRPFAEWPATG